MTGNNLSFSISVRNNATAALNSLKNQVSSLKNGLLSLGSGTKSATSNISTLDSGAKKVNSSFSTLGSTIQRVIGYFGGFRIVNSIFNTITSTISTAIERIDTMDMFQDKMTLITGSAENATKALEELKESTKGTPYALDIAARGVQNFVLRGMETQQAVDSINIWMDAVSTYGKGTNDQFESVIDAIAKMRTKGTVEMRYLNRLFAAGINPVQMYATATGQAAQDVQTALSEKEISSEEFLSVVETAMRDGTNGVLAIQGNAKKLAKTWAAVTANMKIAIARGWADVIDTLDDTFKIIDSERGLKGLVADFGETIENMLSAVATAIKTILPPILTVAKSAFEYWKNYYFTPLKEYFDSFVNPVKESMKAIKEAFNVEGNVDINALTQQLDYQGTGSLRDALLEVMMSWESLKKTSRDTWRGLNPQPDANTQPERYSFDLDTSIYDFLQTLDTVIGQIQSRIPQLLTSFKQLSNAFKNSFGAIIEIILTLVGGIAQFALTLGSIVVPPAMEILAQGFSVIAEVLGRVSNAVKEFAREQLPQLINNVIAALYEIQNSPLVQSISKAFEILGERITNVYNTTRDYIGFLRKENSFTFDPLNVDQSNIIRIIRNLQRLFEGIVEAVKPVKEAITDVFNTDVGADNVTSGFSKILEIIANLSEVAADYIPKIVKIISGFAAKIIRLIKPVGEFLWNLLTDYVVPFAVSVIKAFVSLGIAIAPLISAFAQLAGAVAAFVIPVALTILTNICNWIAEHADIVVAGILSIATAFLTFNAIKTVSVVLNNLHEVLLGKVIPAVSTFFKVMTTEGIAAAISTLVNPVVLIPVVIAALIGLAAGLIYLWNTSDTAREKINEFIASFLTMTTGIKVGSTDVDNAFQQMGEWINNFKDTLDSLLVKIDEFFDKFNGIRNILKIFLQGPGMNYGGWLGDDSEGVTPETTFNPFKDLGVNKIPDKIQMPTLETRNEEYRQAVNESMNAVNEAITQNFPEVAANGNMTIQTLNSAITSAIQNNGAVDTSPLTANIDRIPIEGYEAGSGMGWNLVSGINESTGAVGEASNNMSGTAIGTLNSSLAGEPAFQVGASFINVFNAGFQSQASTSYMMVAGFINNCMTILQAGFNNPESILPTTIASALTNLMALIMARVEIYCQGINDRLIQCYNTFLTSVEVTFNDFVNKHTNTINSIFPNFQNTIKSNLDGTVQKYTDFYNAIVKILNDLNTYHYDLGKAMMESMARGINETMPQVTSTAGVLVQTLKDTFEKGLGIHSPSDYMIWVGQMMLAGLLEGMDENQISKFVTSIINDMRTSFKNGKFNADELVDYMGSDGTMNVVKYLEFIGDQTVSDLFGDGGTPAIIQEALKYVGYAPGGGNSMFGLHYGNPGAWCASFVRYCAEKVGVPFPQTNYVPSVLDWSIATGRYTQTPQPGYAAIFGGGSHIELVAGVNGGTVDMVGGNTGRGEVKHRPRSDATSYVALDGGHSTLTLKDTIMQAWNKKFNPLNLGNYNPSAGASQWESLVLQALAMLGQPSSLLGAVMATLMKESSGNPNAINLTDINAQRGTPSKGLMQVIDPTFAAYALPGYNTNIWDPLSNILASLRYQLARYGAIEAHLNGYAVGTRKVPYDMPAMIHKGEAIIPANQNPYTNSGGDYLADLFSNVIGSSGINDLGFDISALEGGSSGSSTSINNNLNNVFNIHNDNDVNADRNIENMENALHKLLSDAMRAGGSR